MTKKPQTSKDAAEKVVKNIRNGLVLCFPYRSAKIEPVLAKPVLAGTGGGWIDLGLVVMDRQRVRSAAVFA